MEKTNTQTRTTRVQDRANRQSIKAFKRLRAASEGTLEATVEQITASYYICLLAAGVVMEEQP